MTSWITPADVQTWLGPDVDNTTAQMLADAATASVRDYLQRDISLQTGLDEVYDSNNTDYILLNSWPVVSIASVTIEGLPPLVPAAARTPGYRLDRVVPRKLQLAGFGKIARGIMNIAVVYTAGYDMTLPADPASTVGFSNGGPPPSVYTALKLTAAAIYNAQAADPNLASESTGGVFSGSFYPSGVGAVPPGARSMLLPYLRVAP